MSEEKNNFSCLTTQFNFRFAFSHTELQINTRIAKHKWVMHLVGVLVQERRTILTKWQSKANAAILSVLRQFRANCTSDASVLHPLHPLQPLRATSTTDARVLQANTDLVTDLTIESNALYTYRRFYDIVCFPVSVVHRLVLSCFL